MRFSFASLVLLSAIAIPAAAHASTVDTFTIVYGSQTLTYNLPSSPTPDQWFAGQLFEIGNVSAVLNGVPIIDGAVAFYTQAVGGGFIDNALPLSPYGDQYFTGDVTAPTFIPGFYTFNDGQGHDLGTLTITSTPEPSSLLLLGTGILGLAGVARRRFLMS